LEPVLAGGAGRFRFDEIVVAIGICSYNACVVAGNDDAVVVVVVVALVAAAVAALSINDVYDVHGLRSEHEKNGDGTD
jgi:hypothetical protein